MKKFFAWYKDLPKEVKAALALLGLGTPAGIIWMLHTYVFVGVPVRDITIGFALAVVFIALICWAVSTLFTVKQKGRSRRMAADLSRDDQAGPASMDVKAAIKANNEKFFNAVRDMKKNLGVDVYDLPWYIVIGDSGCGKTRLINNGGLTFSTGKPEGYQLGTLNYNWWFTEDAVFVDMAGRLCNPQEDSDHREWQAFLDTIARGRKGFPINGAFVCVSAEHLLSDSPEKHEADANTALERLRELQAKLGVTFATYLIITKCDKILGFMQFFDRAERDITVKNQIFGWAKPGEFNELYDPDAFRSDFNELYHRLNDLRLRRLHDDVSDADLGLAYSFPEEFRELNDPLQTYVRTLFPMIRNPRAMKNLIFRGIFFTSATQEGAVILKHLAQRLGAEAAEQFPSLDQLYPEKRPLFVKDVFFRKAFPEQGLVFRNENDVVRSEKLSKMVKVGSAVLSLLLVSGLVFGYWKLSELISGPLARAKETHKVLVAQPDASLTRGGEFAKDTFNLSQQRFWAGLLSLGTGTDKPVSYIRYIRARLFEESQLRPAFDKVAAALRSPDAWATNGAVLSETLEEYLLWLGCRGQSGASAHLSLDSYSKLVSAAATTTPAADPAGAAQPPANRAAGLDSETANYFEMVRTNADWRSPAHFLCAADSDCVETVRMAVKNAHDKYWIRETILDDQHPDSTIANWMRIRQRCEEVDSNYNLMLGASDQRPSDAKSWESLKTNLVKQFNALDTALKDIAWRGGGTPVRIGSLSDAIDKARDRWLKFRDRLSAAYKKCGGSGDPEVFKAINALPTGEGGLSIVGLDPLLCEQLKSKRLITNCDTDTLNNLKNGSVLKNVHEIWAHIITLTQVPAQKIAENDTLVVTRDALSIQEELRRITTSLAGDASLDGVDRSLPRDWIAELKRRVEQAPTASEKLATMALLMPEPWKEPRLDKLRQAHREWMERGGGTRLLARMYTRLQGTGSLGFADLFPENERFGLRPSAYDIAGQTAAPEPAPTAELEKAKPAPSGRGREEDDGTVPAATTATTPAERKREVDAGGRMARGGEDDAPTQRTADLAGHIPKWLGEDFLDARMGECFDLFYYLGQLDASHFYQDERGGSSLRDDCLSELDRTGAAWWSKHAAAWTQAYAARSIPQIKQLRDSAPQWSALVDALQAESQKPTARIRDDIEAALAEILRAIPFSFHYRAKGVWKEPPPDSAGYRNIAAWRGNATKDAVRTYPFLASARPIDTDGARVASIAPWTGIASRFGGLWADQMKDIIGCGKLPTEFTDRQKTFSAIGWGRYEEARSQSRLSEEKLTSELVAFEGHAKSLLDKELTAVLAAVQSRHSAGGGALPSAGTDFVKFKDFLAEVGRAEKALVNLEQGLETDAGRRRMAFYKQCRDWRDFLGLAGDGASSSTKPLGVTVSAQDPVSNPANYNATFEAVDDTPANLYSKVQLVVGIDKREGGPMSDDGTTWETVTSGLVLQKSGVWNWSTAGSPMKFRLFDGKPDPARTSSPNEKLRECERTIGTTSPLSLVAYMQSNGKSDATGTTWYVLERIDLRTAFEDQTTKDIVKKLPEKSQRMNVGFVFKLERPLPPPINPL